MIERQAQLVRPHFYIGQDFVPDRAPMQRVFTAIIRSLVPRSDNSSIALPLKGGLFVRRRILKRVKTTNIGSIFETKVSVFGRDWPLFALYYIIFRLGVYGQIQITPTTCKMHK